MRSTQQFGLALLGLSFLLTAMLNASELGHNTNAKRTPISTHVLNTASGKPAAGVAVVLQF